MPTGLCAGDQLSSGLRCACPGQRHARLCSCILTINPQVNTVRHRIKMGRNSLVQRRIEARPVKIRPGLVWEGEERVSLPDRCSCGSLTSSPPSQEPRPASLPPEAFSSHPLIHKELGQGSPEPSISPNGDSSISC